MMAVTFYRTSAQRAAQKTRSAQNDAASAASALHRLLDQPNHPHEAIDDCVTRLQRLKATLERHADLVAQLDQVCSEHSSLRRNQHSSNDVIDRQTAVTKARLADVNQQRDDLLSRITASKRELEQEEPISASASAANSPAVSSSAQAPAPIPSGQTSRQAPSLDITASPTPANRAPHAHPILNNNADAPPRSHVTLTVDADDGSDHDELTSAIGSDPLDITHSRNPASSSASLRDPSGSDASLDDYDSNQIFYSSPRKLSLAGPYHR